MDYNNPYWLHWYEQVNGLDLDVKTSDDQVRETVSSWNRPLRPIAEYLLDDVKEKSMLGVAWETSKQLAQNQVKGKLGIAGRVAGRIGMRAVPVVGYGMLAYDMYQIGSWLYEEYIED